MYAMSNNLYVAVLVGVDEFRKDVVQHPVYPYLACPSRAVLCSNADFATCYCFIMPLAGSLGESSFSSRSTGKAGA